MPAPADYKDLLRGPPAGVNGAAYIRMGAENRWAHLEGFNEFIHACCLDGGFKSEPHALHAVRSALAEAVMDVPPAWRKSHRNGGWDLCHPDQVAQACKGPMRFDKACIVLLAVDIACKRNAFKALHLVDVFRHVTLHPAIYKLTGIERWHTLRTMFPTRMKVCELELIDGIKQHLLTCDPRDEAIATEEMAESFLSQALHGRPMTWRNATLLADALNAPVFGKGPKKEIAGVDCLPQRITVDMTKGRNDGGKFTGDKHCNQSEAAFVTLSRARLNALQKDVERSARAAEK